MPADGLGLRFATLNSRTNELSTRPLDSCTTALSPMLSAARSGPRFASPTGSRKSGVRAALAAAAPPAAPTATSATRAAAHRTSHALLAVIPFTSQITRSSRGCLAIRIGVSADRDACNYADDRDGTERDYAL